MAPKRRDSGSVSASASPFLRGDSTTTMGLAMSPSPTSNATKRRKTSSNSFAASSSPSMATQAFVKWDAALRQYSDAMNYPLIRKLYEILYCNRLAEEAHKAIKTHLLEVEQLIVTRKKKLVGTWVSQRESDSPTGKLKINEAFHGIVSFPEKGIETASVSGIIENSNCGGDELRLRIEQNGREGFVQLKLSQNIKDNVPVLAKLTKDEDDDEDAELEGFLFLEEDAPSSQQQHQTSNITDGNRKAIQFKFSLIRKEFAETIEEEDLFNQLVATDNIGIVNTQDNKNNGHDEERELLQDEDNDEDDIDGDIDTSTFALVSAHLNKMKRSSTSHPTNSTSSSSSSSSLQNNGTTNDELFTPTAKKRSTKEQ